MVDKRVIFCVSNYHGVVVDILDITNIYMCDDFKAYFKYTHTHWH